MKLVAVWVLLVSCCLWAQFPEATIRVEVLARSKPMEGAIVNINAVELKTDRNGLASARVPLGELKVVVTKEGFHRAVTSVAVNEAREWAIAVELEVEEEAHEEVTVYATRTDARIQDLAVRVEVLQREEVEEKMMMTPGDIVMMLNEMGGMRVQTTSPSLGAASVRMQGMRGRYTRFLSDGLPLFGQQGAGLGLLQIPPMDLGQVEVIKGISSALYGAAAMAGVVNLISRRPAEEPVREFLLNRTTLGGTDATGFVSTRLAKQWSASFLGGGHWQERRDIDEDGWADVAAYTRGVARPRFYWDGGEGRSALLTGGITIEDRSGGTIPGAVLKSTGSPYSEALNTRRYDLGGTAQWLAADRYVIAGRFSASSLNHTHQFGEVRERDRHELLFGEVSVRGAAGRHTWVTGVAAERDAYRPRDVERFAYTFVTPGVFVQDDVRLSSWLSISASARADFHNQYGTFLSPRLSGLLRWKGWTSRLSAGQGFFASTPLTEETEAAGLARLSMPASLRPERGRSASFDLTRSVGPVSVTTTLFFSRVKNPVVVDRGTRYAVVNLSEPTTNRGMELLGTWRKAPFAVTGSYAYVRSRELQLTGGHSDVPLTPRHSAGVVAFWEQEGKGRVGLECYYTGKQRLEYDPYDSFSRPYVIVGAMGERKISSHVRLFLNLENLSDVRQTRWSSVLRPTRSPDGRWTVDAWAPLDGRVVNGGVRLIF